jgi:hypothetical protein
MHVVDGVAGTAQTVDKMPPRVFTWEPRVDYGNAALVFEYVAIHVSETGHADRQLSAQDAVRDFRYNGRCLFLLLLRFAGHLSRIGTRGRCSPMVVVVLHEEPCLRQWCCELPSSSPDHVARSALQNSQQGD